MIQEDKTLIFIRESFFFEGFTANEVDKINIIIANARAVNSKIREEYEQWLVLPSPRFVEVTCNEHPKMEAPIYQISDGLYPKESFKYPKTREKLLKITQTICGANLGKQVLVVVPKKWEEYFKGNLPKFATVEHHYGNLHGTNAYASYDAIIIVGSPQQNIKVVSQELEFNYGRAPIDEELRKELEERYVVYLYDVLNRIRPFQNPKKQIYILSNIKLQNYFSNLNITQKRMVELRRELRLRVTKLLRWSIYRTLRGRFKSKEKVAKIVKFFENVGVSKTWIAAVIVEMAKRLGLTIIKEKKMLYIKAPKNIRINQSNLVPLLEELGDVTIKFEADRPPPR